jgi:hypothetical protein
MMEGMTAKHYATLKGLGTLTGICGVFSLLGHLAGQMSQGAASAATLIGGVIAVAVGSLLFVLADIGEKVSRSK